ncbi:TetR/AcrR family transcriptional regulator [Streptodolium elevatio]
MPARIRPLRADAARNRDKLLAAGTQVFAERGLDAPLEEVARRAGVSIGTLYNHFPTRQAFLVAILPGRLEPLERITAAALADPDPWTGFVAYLDGLFALQAADRGLNDAVARQFRQVGDVHESCPRGLEDATRIIERARRSGRLRADFEVDDLVVMIWAMSQVIRESADTAPDAWRRCLSFFLHGLDAGPGAAAQDDTAPGRPAAP